MTVPLPLLPRQLAGRLSALALCALSLSLHAQSSQYLPLNRGVVFLDAAHGGADNGAQLSKDVAEKDVTLAFSQRLRGALTSAGFNVIVTRDADSSPAVASLTPDQVIDQRASAANRAHPVACVLIHATSSGTGVHILTSTITPAEDTPAVLSWESAQSIYLAQSLRLANLTGTALLKANLPVLLSRASARPIDNLTCPAIALELAPLRTSSSDVSPVTDAAYQDSIAKTLTAALTSWRTAVEPINAPARFSTAPSSSDATPRPHPAAQPAAVPPPHPAPIVRHAPATPEATPATGPDAPVTKPAPVVRRPPTDPATLPPVKPRSAPPTPPRAAGVPQ